MEVREEPPIRILIAKTSLDGHIRGLIAVAQPLRDAGMEVIYGGVLTPEQIIAAAIQENVDVIGLNIGGRYGTARRLMDMIQHKNMTNIIVIAGDAIPPEDIALLKEWGIKEVFIRGSSLGSIITCIEENVKR